MFVLAWNIFEMMHKELGNSVYHWEEKLGGWGQERERNTLPFMCLLKCCTKSIY